jgi:putative transposase
MVDDPGAYIWSSYQFNALGKVSGLCKPHPEYMKLGKRKDVRMGRYRELFAHHVEEKLLTEIREGLNKGMALGNERIKEEIEVLTGRRLKPKKVGRPVGWRKKKSGE